MSTRIIFSAVLLISVHAVVAFGVGLGDYETEILHCDGDSIVFKVSIRPGVPLEYESVVRLRWNMIIPNECTHVLEVLDSNYVSPINEEYEEPPADDAQDMMSAPPTDVPWDPPYDENSYTCARYVFRDFHGCSVYRQVAEAGRIFTELTFKLSFTDAHNYILPNEISADFDHIYESFFENYDFVLPQHQFYRVPGKLLIVTDPIYRSTVTSLANWKTQSGIQTYIANVTDINRDSLAIMDTIRTYYEDYAISWVLLVGEGIQIPYFYYRTEVDNDSLNVPSDPIYGLIEGNDLLPELFVGRFSGLDTSQIQTQVQRTIEYEMAMHGGEWLNRAMCIGDYEIGEVVQNLLPVTDSLKDASYWTVDTLGPPFGNGDSLSAYLNEGRGIVFQDGHGQKTGWDRPYYHNTQVNQLTNVGQLPAIFSAACHVGDFADRFACFAETWLRATDQSGAPTGAVAAAMASQDGVFSFGVIEQVIAYEIKRGLLNSFGALLVRGLFLTRREGWDWDSTSSEWTAEESNYDYFLYHTFGDPSLRVFTHQPDSTFCNFDPCEPYLSSVMNLGVPPRAICALSRDSVLYGSAVADENGLAQIEMNQPLPPGKAVVLTVTGHNKIPYIDTLSFDTSDMDGFVDCVDNCPTLSNPGQEDFDADGVGDVCDNCLATANFDQLDSDSDSFGDSCDNCPDTANLDQRDSDLDGIGDICDNCRSVANTEQTDTDGDGIGDACEGDSDGDGIIDDYDNCIWATNAEQMDSNGDGMGDACSVCDSANSSCELCGDITSDGLPDISDVQYLTNMLFYDGPAAACRNTADLNGDGWIDISDLAFLVKFLFNNSGEQLGSCPSACE